MSDKALTQEHVEAGLRELARPRTDEELAVAREIERQQIEAFEMLAKHWQEKKRKWEARNE